LGEGNRGDYVCTQRLHLLRVGLSGLHVDRVKPIISPRWTDIKIILSVRSHFLSANVFYVVYKRVVNCDN